MKYKNIKTRVLLSSVVIVLGGGLVSCSTENLAASGESAKTESAKSDTVAPETGSSSITDVGGQAKSAEVEAALAVDAIDRTMWQRTLISSWCLKASGVPAMIDPREPQAVAWNIVPGMTDEQIDAIDDKCTEKYRLNEEREPTRADAEKEFNHRMKTAQCMQKKGFITSDAPSKNAFVDKYLAERKSTKDLRVWSPWDEYLDGSSPGLGECQKMLEDCPRYRSGA